MFLNAAHRPLPHLPCIKLSSFTSPEASPLCSFDNHLPWMSRCQHLHLSRYRVLEKLSTMAVYKTSPNPLVANETESKDSNQIAGSGRCPFTISSGESAPLGPSVLSNGVNFALYSAHATSVTLCLFPGLDGVESKIEIMLDPMNNKTGNVWHVCVEELPLNGITYGYHVDGPRGWENGHRFDKNLILIDPYAKLIEGRRHFGDRNEKNTQFFGTYDFTMQFDWGNDDKRMRILEKDLVIYEMNVRAFTADESSNVSPEHRGTYLGLIEKIPHLVELGVNAVELLPVFEFDEFEFQRRPNGRDHMINTWGYSTINFFSPMSRYASCGGGPVAASLEFKQMVKAFHQAGIEVILDVVYNHTNEADDEFPYTTSFRGIDNLTYYMVDTSNFVQLRNYSGCGNTLNCNNPVVMELVIESLKHWVNEYHIDGFRFDLASSLCRDVDGNPLNSPPIIRAISKDPAFSECKLIAEPWDCGGLYQVGSFPNWDRWAEWNGRYRDDVRKFVKGDDGMKSSFATRLSGSADLYQVHNRKPFHSINFIVAHDGFSLYDLVAYNEKHNDANGEGGRDGSNDNFSWNCGFEGETTDDNVNSLRSRQMKNFHIALMLSQGTPMMLMGDEYAHTKYGNNNSYGHDTAMNHFQWTQLEKNADDQFRFFKKVISLRKNHPLLGRDNFLRKEDVTWHEDNWDNQSSHFLAFTLHSKEKETGDIYVAFSAHDYEIDVNMPAPPNGKCWYRVVDTHISSPDDFVEDGIRFVGKSYRIGSFSCIVFIAKE